MASGFLSSLYISLRANTADFQTDMGRAARIADRQAKAIKSGVQGALKDLWAPLLAGFSVAAVTSQLKQITDNMLQVSIAAKQVAMPVDEFSALAAVAKNADVNMDAFSTGLTTMARNLALAQQGSKQAAGAFQALGLDPAKLKDSKTAFLAISDALSKYRDGVGKTAVEQQIFGKAGAQLNNVLDQGSAAIAQQAQHMRDLGVALDEDATRKLEAFGAQSKELGNTLQGVGQRIVVALLPALTSVNQNLADFAQHGDVTEFASGLAPVMTTLGRAGMVVAGTFSEAGRAIGATFAIVRTAFQGINPLLLSNPLTAPAALAVGIAKNAKNVAAVAKEAGSDIASNFSDWMQRISQFGDAAVASAGKAKAAAGGKPELTVTDPNAAAKALQQARQLQQAYAALATTAQNAMQPSESPLDKAITEHAKTLQELGKAVDAYVQKGGQLANVQGLIDSAVGATNQKYQQQVAAIEAQQNAFQQALDQEVASRKNAIDIQVQSIGMGDKEAGRLQEINALEQQRLERVQALQLQQTTHPEQYAELAKQITATNAAFADMVNSRVAGFARMDVAQADWHNGFTKAMANLADQADNVAGAMESTFSSLFDGIGDAIANFAQTGKLNFADLTRSLLADIIKIETRILISRVLTSMFGGAQLQGIGANYMANGGASYAASGVDWSVKLANGGAFAGGLQKFATGGIVSNPTLFKFAQGTGLMGEAGPEAIVPLSRTSNGKLGISAQGLGGGKTTVIIENHSDSKADVQQSSDGQGGNLIRVIVGQAVAEVGNQIGRGGNIGKIIQQTYGLNRRGVPVGA